MAIINNSMPDVRKGTAFVKTAKIVSDDQLKSFFSINKIDENRYQKIKTIMLKNNFMYAIKDTKFFVGCLSTSYKDLTKELNKAIWLYISNCNKVDFINFDCKFPCIMHMLQQSDDNKTITDFSVFYVKNNEEELYKRLIETSFGGYKSTINTIIIIDNREQINKINLDFPFNIYAYAIVNDTGIVEYFKKEG